MRYWRTLTAFAAQRTAAVGTGGRLVLQSRAVRLLCIAVAAAAVVLIVPRAPATPPGKRS